MARSQKREPSVNWSDYHGESIYDPEGAQVPYDKSYTPGQNKPSLPKMSIRFRDNHPSKEDMIRHFKIETPVVNLSEDLLKARDNPKLRGRYLKKQSPEAQRQFTLAVPDSEDCMIRQSKMELIQKKTGIVPYIDMCANEFGDNAMCPLYYDAKMNSCKQAENLAGHKIQCNPPFSGAEPFIIEIERAIEICSGTEAVLVVPVRKTDNTWWNPLTKSKTWRCAHIFDKKEKLFSKPSQAKGAKLGKRKMYGKAVEDIAIFHHRKWRESESRHSFDLIESIKQDPVKAVIEMRKIQKKNQKETQ